MPDFTVDWLTSFLSPTDKKSNPQEKVQPHPEDTQEHLSLENDDNQPNMVEVSIPPEYFAPPQDQTESEDIPEYKINVINDSDHPNLRKGIVEPDGSISLYLFEGVDIVAVSYEQIHKLVQSGQTEFKAFMVIKVSIDPETQRSCKWFSPARQHVEAYGAAVASEYAFDRAHKYGSCSNPQIIKDTGQAAPACPWFAQAEPFSKCNLYEPDPIQVELALLDTNSNLTLKLTKVRRNFGLLEFDVVKEDPQGNTGSVIESTILINDTQTDWQSRIDEIWSKAVDEHLGDSDNRIDVTHKFLPETAQKDPYINHVLEFQS